MGDLTLGMNPAEVREFAKSVDAAAKLIGDIRSTLTGKLSGTSWTGQDAASFRSAWSSSHAPSLASAAEALGAAATTARSNADAQERTSDVDGGAVTGGGSDDGPISVSGGHLGSSLPANRTHLGGWTENTFTDGKGTVEAGWGADAKYGTSGKIGTGTYSASGESGAGVKAWAGTDYGVGSANLTDNDPFAKRDAGTTYADMKTGQGDPARAVAKQGLYASGSAGAEAGAWSNGRASLHNGGILPSTVAANYDALAGARAQGSAGGNLSWDGVRAGAQGDAFAGARIDGGGSVDVGGIGAGASAGVSAGIGANAGADVSLGKDGVHVSANLGATFGVGANFKVNLSVNPGDIPGASLVGDVAHSGAVKSVVHHLNPLSW